MTEAEILAWLRRDNVKRVVLLELDYMYQVGVSESAVPTRGTLYFSNFAYTDESGSPLIRYQAVLLDAPEYERSIDRTTLRGKYNVNVGSTVINNADGEFDYLLDLAIDGSEQRVYIGDESWARSDFVHLFTALSVKASAPRKRIVQIDLRDPGLLLNKSIGGMVIVGGPEGSPTITNPSANRFRPINFGYVHQAEPILYDKNTSTYVHSDTGDATAVEVRNDGVPVTFVDNADGTFSLTVPPAGNERITCDVLAYTVQGSPNGSPTDYRMSDAIRFFVGERAGLEATGRFYGAHPTYFDSGVTDNPLNDYHVGIHLPESRNVIDLLDEMMSTANGFWATLRTGEFYYGRMRPEALSAIIALSGGRLDVSAEIAKDDIRGDSMKIEHNIPTYASYQSYANINWTTQTTFASSLDVEEREKYTRKGLYSAAFRGEDTGSPLPQAYRGDIASWKGGAPELYHLSLSDSQVVSTLISGASDTDVPDPVTTFSISDYQAAWASIRRSQHLPWMEFIDLRTGLDFYELELGDIVNFTLDRHSLNGGKLLQVCKIRIKPMKAEIDLGIVRRRFADVAVAPNTGTSYLLQENGDLILQESGDGILIE